jgi:hypothetical protein
MAEKYGHLSLKLNKPHILNCFGMQPIFYKNGCIDESFVGSVYRVGTCWNVTGNMHYLSSYRFGDDTNHILNNKFHINDANKTVVNFLLNDRTFSFKQNCSLEYLLEKGNEAKLKEVLLLHFERIKYYTMMCKGNFIITSNKTLYNKTLFNNAEVRNFNMYLVDENLLPKNVLILGHSNRNSFRTPYVACPLIDKNHFDEICKLNGINLKEFDNLNTKTRFPLTISELNLYSLYQSYLDNVDVPFWYIEDFGYPVKTRQKAYYTTLFFD